MGNDLTLQEEWDSTTRHLEWLNKQFCALHEKPSKDWDSNDHYVAREYREGAKSTGEYRYWILQRARKEGVKID